MSAATAPATRRVRVTLEGDARPLAHLPDLLRVALDGGATFLVDPHAAGTTVEDVEPPRVWTDGDVVMYQGLSRTSAATRHKGKWWTTAQAMDGENGKPWAESDDMVTRCVDQGLYVVLRYQAGEQ